MKKNKSHVIKYFSIYIVIVLFIGAIVYYSVKINNDAYSACGNICYEENLTFEGLRKGECICKVTTGVYRHFEASDHRFNKT